MDRVQGAGLLRYNPADPHAVMIDQRMAALAHLRPGGFLHVLAIPGFTTNAPDFRHAVPLALRVSGIVRFDDELVPDNQGPGRAAGYRVTGLRPPVPASLLLAVGERLRADPAAARGQPRGVLRRGPGPGPPVHSGPLTGPWTSAARADEVAITQRAMRPDAVALAAFAAAAGLVGLVILVQMLGRQVVLDTAEFPILRALGAGRGTLAAASLAEVAAVTTGGGLLGVGIAIAASPFMPLGPARLAEPSPGVEVNLAILGAGLAVTVLLPLLLLLPVAWRAARAACGPLGVAEPAAPARPSRLGLALATAGSVTGGIGMRMALEPGHGPDRGAGAQRPGRNHGRGGGRGGRGRIRRQPGRAGDRTPPVRPELDPEGGFHQPLGPRVAPGPGHGGPARRCAGTRWATTGTRR